jgi:hypothetical protein
MKSGKVIAAAMALTTLAGRAGARWSHGQRLPLGRIGEGSSLNGRFIMIPQSEGRDQSFDRAENDRERNEGDAAGNQQKCAPSSTISCEVGHSLMSDVRDTRPIDAPVSPAHQPEVIKDRRRPRRIQDISPALIPLMRNPTAGLVAGDLAPIGRFQIVAAWTAAAYPADIWLNLSSKERSEAIYHEMGKLDAARAARSRTEFATLTKVAAKEDC